jgi:hypothetical protein
MKLALPALVLVPFVAACQTRPAVEAPQSVAATPQPAAAFTASGNLDLATGSMNVEDFLHACQESAGLNFTYTKSTRTALLGATLRFDQATHVPASEAPAFITSTLAAHGFTVKPIGPEHLRVLLIEPKRD